MQVFIIGTPFDTAVALDKFRLRKQIIECGQILDAINGKKAWKNHPCTKQYAKHAMWLEIYKRTLELYEQGDYYAELCSQEAERYKPPFHTKDFLDQMKRRLYTKNNNHYKKWAHLGESLENWYWSDKENKFIKYCNGIRIN